jgi:hypothetical protein
VQSICGVLNNVFAYKQKVGGNLMIAELNQNSTTSDTQIESKELCNVIARAEKIATGHI